jgi:DNA-binding SARP family transcriptional activator
MEVRLLGPVELWTPQGEVPLGTPRRRCVLTVLAMTPGQPVTSDKLVEAVWGHQLPGNVRNVLYTHVSRLRGRLEAADEASGRAALRRTRGGYVLDIEPDRVDLHRSRRLAAEARSATGADERERAADLLAQACALWRGTPLSGVPGGWAERIRTGLIQERLAMLTDRYQRELQLGRHTAVIGPLSDLLADHPLAESLAGLLMRALYLAGWQADALQVYARLRRHLAEEIGADPGPELRQLHEQVLRGEPALEPGPSPQVSTGPAPPSTTTPARPEPARPEPARPEPARPEPARPEPACPEPARPAPAQLPPVAAAFTGRGAYLRWLDSLSPDPGEGGCQPVTIAAIEGAAGVGKTALAVRWAHRNRARFADGQLYANLRGHVGGARPLTPMEVLVRFLHALGVAPEQVPTELDEAVAAYRSLLADRRVLVVLDDVANAEQIRPLLPGGGGCMVLVTSRDQLDGLVARDGAQRLALDTLPADEAHALLARTIGDARVQAEPEAVTALVEACGRLPLALRIAAANLTARPTHRIADYVAQLRSSDRLALLRITGDEQTAVAAAFDLSYDRLTEPARRMFRLLGLVPGPDITAQAAAAVVDETPEGARALLDTLVGAHLAEERHPGRFACHDLLRHYAAARARQQEAPEVREAALARLFDHYLCTASAAVRVAYPLLVRLPPPPECASLSPGFTDAEQAWHWLDAERANLVAVAVHAAGHGPRATAWRLADTLRAYFVLRTHLVDWETVAQAGLTALAGGVDPLAHAAVHHSLAGLRFRQSRLDEAIGHASEALGHAREAGWTEGEAAMLNTLASAQWLHGDPHAARESFARAVELFEQAGWHSAVAPLYGNLARVSTEIGRFAEAEDHAARALEATRAAGIRQSEAINLEVLGEISHVRGATQEAIGYFREAREVSRAIGFSSGEGDAMCGLAAVYRDLGAYADAEQLASEALTVAREHSHHRLEVECLNVLAGLRLAQGQDAVAQYQQALTRARETGNRYPEAEALIGLATSFRHRNEYGRARRYANQALAVAREVGYRLQEGRALAALATVVADAGDAETAGAVGRQARSLLRDLGVPDTEVDLALSRVAP